MVDGDVLAALRAKVALIESSDGLPERAAGTCAAARAVGTPDESEVSRGPHLSAPLRFGAPVGGGEPAVPAEFPGCDGAPSRRKGGGRAAGGRPAQEFTEESALRRIERLCNVSEQCSSKLRTRLLREGWAPSQVEGAIRRARACLLVDDERYASVLVRSRIAQRKGVPGILAELQQLGYGEDYARELVDAQTAEDECGSEVQRALAVLEARPPRSKNLHDGAYRKLMGRGFGSEVSSEAATLFCERHG